MNLQDNKSYPTKSRGRTKNMRKKIIGMFICILIVGTVFVITPTTVSADLWENGYFYTVIGGAAIITGYTGPGGMITLPLKLGRYPTRFIDPYAFVGHYELTSVTILIALPTSVLVRLNPVPT